MNSKARVDGKIVEVVETTEEFYNNPELYKPNYAAMQIGDTVYPFRGPSDIRPGIYQKNSFVSVVKEVDGETAKDYSAETKIDFNPTTIKEAIDIQAKLKGTERYILETADHITHLNISDKCKPQMKALKEAINLKQMNLDNYEQRFGDNYNNDRRLLEKDDITLNKMVSIADNTDIKVTVVVEDASPDVPNPMGQKISVELTSGGQYD